MPTKTQPKKRAYARKTKPEPYLGYQELGWLPAAQSCKTEHIDENVAFNFSAFYCAVNGISDDVMILPLHLYRRSGERREMLPSHPISRLLRVGPNPEMDTPTFVKYLVSMRLAWGNGYAEIVRDGSGMVEMLIPIHSRRVFPKRTGGGYLYYEVTNPDGSTAKVPSDDMLHLRGMTHDGVNGLSVVGYARECIGMALSAEKHGHQFFGNSCRPGILIMKPKRMGDAEENNLRKSMEKFNATGSRYGVMALEEGTTIKEIGMPHADAEFLATRLFQVQEMCRWFRLAPNKLGDYSQSHLTNILESNIQHHNDVIVPNVVPFECEMMRKLLLSQDLSGDDLYFKFNLNGLLRGKGKERAEYYQLMINCGGMTINEVRALEELNPIGPDGDKHRVPLNSVAVEDEDKIREEKAKAADKAPAAGPGRRKPAGRLRSQGGGEIGHNARLRANEAEGMQGDPRRRETLCRE
jgi:HK97 family phage portal protein